MLVYEMNSFAMIMPQRFELAMLMPQLLSGADLLYQTCEFDQGQIFIFCTGGVEKFQWGASHMQHAILDSLGGT